MGYRGGQTNKGRGINQTKIKLLCIHAQSSPISSLWLLRERDISGTREIRAEMRMPYGEYSRMAKHRDRTTAQAAYGNGYSEIFACEIAMRMANKRYAAHIIYRI